MKQAALVTSSAIAEKERLMLIKDYGAVIYFPRNFYQQYHKAPPIRILMNHLAVQIRSEKATSIYLNDLFPKGVLKQASKLAGLLAQRDVCSSHKVSIFHYLLLLNASPASSHACVARPIQR